MKERMDMYNVCKFMKNEGNMTDKLQIDQTSPPPPPQNKKKQKQKLHQKQKPKVLISRGGRV